MAKPGQSSFRRILLSRILLLSVPVLLMGVYVTYRKARSSLLETARQNLTESAVRNGESIQFAIDALSAHLAIASESKVLSSQQLTTQQAFLGQFLQSLPIVAECSQLIDLQTQTPIASTCRDTSGKLSNNVTLLELPPRPYQRSAWPAQQPSISLDRSNIQVYRLLPNPNHPLDPLPGDGSIRESRARNNNQLRLVFSAPVYNEQGALRYVLAVQASLLQQQRTKEGSLAGYPVVIDQDGTILAHPISKRIGTNVSQGADANRLQSLIRNAIAGQQNFLHLFSLEKNGVELVAGYTSIASPLHTGSENSGVKGHNPQRWVILAVSRLDSALAGLEEIQQVLFILTFGLIAASLLATLYIARDLARPLEKLTEYAKNQHLHPTELVPNNFQIREFNQLSQAIGNMVERLRAWAEELESAWKEAQTANQLKSEFLATTSHELRTPLNAIIGCIRLVRDGCCDDQQEEAEFLQRADDAAIHLLGIINDVLDLAKIEAGKLSVVLETLDVQKLLEEVIKLQRVAIEQKGLSLQVSLLEKLLTVQADPAKLKQVMLNVLGNATKFTEQGGITVDVRMEPIPPGGGPNGRSDGGNGAASPLLATHQVVIMIKDTGIGIDPAQQDKLFRPFVMVDGSTTRQFGGTGLGLAISRNLMQLMGGSIILLSAGKGLGSTVEITLPLMDAAAVPHKTVPATGAIADEAS